MKRFVLDASALLRFADNEAGVDRVAELAKLARRNQAELYISSVNWGEVVYALLRASRYTRRRRFDQESSSTEGCACGRQPIRTSSTDEIPLQTSLCKRIYSGTGARAFSHFGHCRLRF